MKSLYNLILVAFVIGITNFYSNAQCDHTVTLRDSYGDGWNGGSITVNVNGAPVLLGLTIASGAGPESHTFTAKDGDAITVDYLQGSYGYENYFSVQDGGNNYLTSGSYSATEWRPASGYDGSPWVGTGACPAPSYCSADGGTIDEYIAQVDFLNISNASGSSLYTDYTGIVADPIAVGETHPISIVNGQAYNSDQLGIWIDWNQDTDFDDAGETITVSGGPEIWTANITVPGSVPAGQTTTRMRIRIMYTGSVSSCGSASYGEVEDYTITTIGSSPCSGTPTGGTASLTASDNCAATQGTLTASGFENSTSGLSYDWEFSANGSSGWASTGVTGSTAYGTPASTTYYRYATTCATSGITAYTNVIEKTVATVTAGSDVTRCGTGTVDLTASTNDGSVNWYAASSGGSSLSSGGTYSPSISSSTTYYAASSGCTGTRVAVTGTVNEVPTAAAGSDVDHCNGSSSVLSGSGSMTAPAIPSGYAACYATSTADTYISNVTFNSISTTTGANTAGSETDNTGTVIAVDAGSSYTLSITTADASGSAYTHGIAAFIDWNRDGDFADAEETVYTTSSEVAVGTYSTTVNVPPGASEGDMMLRVVANESSSAPSSTGTYSWGETEKYTVRVTPVLTYAWTPDVDLDNAAIAQPTTSTTSTRTYTLTVTAGNGCTGTDDVIATVNELPVAGSVGVDLTLAHYNQVITWTGTGSANGDYLLHYEWTDSTATAPTGAWNAWVSSNPQTWNTNYSGSNLNRKLWVKSTTASVNGCGTVESTPVSTLVTNCRADATTASVTAGTTSSMPFGETITWDANYYGTFDSWEYMWSSAPGVWNNNWSTSDPHSWLAAGQPPGQTLSVRAKITGGSVSGSGTCTWYSDAIETYIIDCDADAVLLTNNEAGSATEVTCSNTGISVTASNADSYTWSDGSSTDASREFTAAGTYTVTGAKTNGCQTTGSITITVNNTTPSVSLTNNESGSETEVTCANGEISVTASGADSYTWSDGASTDAARDLTSAATYTVSGTSSSNGCTGTAEITITEDTNPPTVVASDDASLCSGSSATITASGAATYEWDNSAGSSSSVSVSPSAQTTYTVTGTATNGCTGQDVVVISVDVAPTLSSSASVTDVSTCGESSLGVAVSANAGEGSWSNTGTGTFDGSTDASTTFQTNTFDTPMTLTWTHSTGACSGTELEITAQFNQPQTTSLNSYNFDNECWIWGGLTNTEWSTAANWYKYDGSKWLRQSSSTPGASDKVYLMSYTNAGSLCVSNSNNAIIPAAAVTDLIVGSGAVVDLNGSFSLAGNLTNNGTINYGTSSVSMTGGSDQTISGSSTTLNNLTVNKTGGSLIVSTPMTVMGTLDMSAGNIVNSSIVILGSSSTDPGTLSHTTGIITGEFRRYFPNATGSQLFPIGTASIMRDVSVNFTSAPGTNQYLTASYVTGAPTLFGGGAYEGLPLVTENGQLITNYDNEGHWVINPTNDDYTSTINGKAYTISLHMNGIADATDYSKTRIIKSAGSNTASQHHLSWEALTSQSVSGYNGANPSNSNFAVTATSTGFSVFGGGSDNGDPLPVELVSFNGSCNDGLVELIWETASEYNSSHFDVENSRDGIIWDVVKTIEAAGNSNEMLTYKYTDVNAHGGNNYYRLTQVDIDGTSKTYDIINVSCSQTTAGYFSIFPNPSSGSFQVILNNSDIIGDAEMNIVDTKGNSVLMKSIDVKSGINMYVVDEELAPGIYYICVKNGDKTTIVLKHSVK